MSVKMQLDILKIERENLQTALSIIRVELTDVETQIHFLKEKEEILQSKTSSLVPQIRQQVKTKIEELERKIKPLKRQKEEMDAKISENGRLIAEKEDNPECYIDEQAKRMITELLDYIGQHKLEIGGDLKRKFFIRELQDRKEDVVGSFQIPTGNIGIYDEKSGVCIIKSSDFYFKQALCHTSRKDLYTRTVVQKTQWYEDYVKSFVATLLTELEARYKENDDLKLTIGENGFILELV